MKKRTIIKLVSAILALTLLASCVPQNKGSVSSTSAEKEWVLGEAYIPENNPAPVLINREDAATPTPISYTDKIVGEELNVEIRTLELANTNDEEWTNHIAIIRSYDELEAIHTQDSKYLRDRENYTSFYNSEHFADNVLIMMFFYNHSCSFRYKIDRVTTSEECMYIYRNNVDYSKDWYYLAEGAYYRTFISVSRKYMENIKAIVVYEDELFYDQKKEGIEL